MADRVCFVHLIFVGFISFNASLYTLLDSMGFGLRDKLVDIVNFKKLGIFNFFYSIFYYSSEFIGKLQLHLYAYRLL